MRPDIPTPKYEATHIGALKNDISIQLIKTIIRMIKLARVRCVFVREVLGLYSRRDFA